jgi:hypothetical protein
MSNYFTTGIVIDSINLLSNENKDENGKSEVKQKIEFEWSYIIPGTQEVQKTKSITLRPVPTAHGKELEDKLAENIDKTDINAVLVYLIKMKLITPTSNKEGVLNLEFVPYQISKLLFYKYVTSFLLAYNLELAERN